MWYSDTVRCLKVVVNDRSLEGTDISHRKHFPISLCSSGRQPSHTNVGSLPLLRVSVHGVDGLLRPHTPLSPWMCQLKHLTEKGFQW